MSKMTEIFYLIKTDIEKGNIVDKLPSENRLCELYDCSRSTIRLVIGSLHSYGIIDSKQGKGHYVSKNMTQNNIKSFEEKQLLRKQKHFDNQIQNLKYTDHYEGKYDLEKVVMYQKLRKDNDVVIEESYVLINKWLINKFDLVKAQKSVLEFLEKDQGIKLKYEENYMKCVKRTDQHLVQTNSNLLIYSNSIYFNENDEIVCIIDYFLAPEYFVTKNIYYGK